MKKVEISKKKFIRNIVITIIALVIVAYILNMVPGYARDKFEGKIQLVIGAENYTEELTYDIYINDEEVVYLSKEDIANFFDATIYYDKKEARIITSSNEKVASMVLKKKEININGYIVPIDNPMIEKEGVIYVPIVELAVVYNIQVNYIKDTNILVIDELNKQKMTAGISRDTNLKNWPRGLSRTVGELKKGERVEYFNEPKNGWVKVRMGNGQLGYVKEDGIVNTYVIRQDMPIDEIERE